MASTYLSRTNTSPTSAYKCTFSGWVKRSKLGSRQRLMTVINPSSTGAYYFVEFTSGDNLGVNDYDGVSSGGIGGSTARKFRDTNAWYHIVVAYDTTQSTGTNRIKVYVNGVEDTFNFDATGDQNRTLSASVSGKTQFIGYHGTSGMYWDGSMSHVHFVDGIAYNADTFGETDSTTGIWKPKTAPSVTYGNNGFFLKFENSAAMGTDSAGSNNLTVNGTMTQLIDTPSNVFATFLPIPRIAGGSPVHPTFSNGNTTAYFDNASYNENAVGSLAMNSGKYYWEVKMTNANSDASGTVGIVDLSSYDNGFIGTQCVGYEDDGTKINEGTATSYGNSYTSGDIIGVAFNASTGTIWFSKNGTWQNSATITEIENGTTTNSAYTGLSTTTDWQPLVTNYQDRYASINFGNGYFGTTAVSSAQNPDDGIGIFEYDVPAGYRALCTKSINAQEYS